MTRTEAIDLIQAKLPTLADERVEVLAELALAWGEPCVYESLPDIEKAAIETALDELDRGEGIPWNTVKHDLEAKLKKAGV